jgi:predicted GNAT family N-acyltransferase
VSGAVRRAEAGELAAALELRRRVFCAEQGVPEVLERDGRDGEALHLVALDAAGEVVGTCRLLRRGDAMVLQRMAVERAARGSGVGARMLALAHAEAAAAGAREVELHAQLEVRGFYARAGYAAEGVEFEEAGIVHVLMRRAVP